MKVVYTGPEAQREIAATGQTVNTGETVDVPDNIGAALCEQEYFKPYRTADVDNTVEGVLDSVGDDAELARAALDAERAGQARKTLVTALEKIVNGEGA